MRRKYVAAISRCREVTVSKGTTVLVFVKVLTCKLLTGWKRVGEGGGGGGLRISRTISTLVRLSISSQFVCGLANGCYGP